MLLKWIKLIEYEKYEVLKDFYAVYKSFWKVKNIFKTKQSNSAILK